MACSLKLVASFRYGIIFSAFYKMNFMNRDGFKTSLWQDKMPDYTPVTKNITDQIFDVLIVGGGVTGITTALELQKAGKNCILAEAQNLCFGTTGGTKLTLIVFSIPVMIKLNQISGKIMHSSLRVHVLRH